MKDMIYRQAAIDMFQQLAYDDWNQGVSTTWANAYAESADMIKELPSAQQWIPCSERLPEEGQVVLTQAKFKHDIKFCVSSRQDFNYWTGWNTREINVVAWMPLPEPWKGDM